MLSFIPSFEKSDEQYSGNRMFNIDTKQYVVNNITDTSKPIDGGGTTVSNNQTGP